MRNAARVLGLDEVLAKKPRTLSGGQRQRVAMGRAIVREPQAFLMDEPLSNLDAKLCVQMRAEIARIQRDLAVTTIYVTHDQSEAMTLGDRVAVMRKGELQQLDTPQNLYRKPVNLFVAEFIGSPAMNLVEAEVAGGQVRFGDHALPVDSRPGLDAYEGRKVALGIRPRISKTRLSDAPAGSRLPVTVDLREDMGSEIFLHFSVDAPHVATEDVRDAVEAEEAVAALEQQVARRGRRSSRASAASRRPARATGSRSRSTRACSTSSTSRPAPRSRSRLRPWPRSRPTPARQQVKADAKEFVLHSWSVQSAIDPIPVAGAEGRHFWDYDGKRYLDFASQLVNVSIGYGHPKVVAAIKEQAEKLATIGPPMATEPRSTLARMLADVTPGNLKMSFFTNGGAEANENAIKVARWVTGRHKIIARYRSYHGATGGRSRSPATRAAGTPSPGCPASCGCSTPTPTAAPPGIPIRARSARARRTSRRSSSTRARTRSPPSSSRRSSARTGSSCRPTATCSRSARPATGTGSCSSSTR